MLYLTASRLTVNRAVVAIVSISLALSFSASTATAQTPVQAEQVEQAIGAGEFAVADQLSAKRLSRDAHEAVLAQVAVAQSFSGDPVSAASTLRQVDSAERRRAAVSGLRSNAIMPAGAGGGSFADFQSLMNLIETTVVPDTWEALGGNSTMAPYPQGVYVDPSGTLMDGDVAASIDAGEVRDRIDNLLGQDATSPPGVDWKRPSPLRCVSLKRLRDAIAAKRIQGQPLGEELLHLAGLSRVDSVMLTEDDVVIAAAVGGIETNRGWYVDRESGRVTLRSDFLARCFAATLRGTPFGCTIDPTAEGMRAAAAVAGKIQSGEVPIGAAAERLRDALGMQRIDVFGAAGDTVAALLMVEADRHMKQLALGLQPLPGGVDSYPQIVDQTIASGPPNGLLLRLWFTADRLRIRSDAERRVFEVRGRPIRLSAENQRALAGGGRGNVTIDPRSETFVAGFNRHWADIRDQYPIYGGLESLYHTAAIAELIQRFGQTEVHRQLAAALALEDDARDWHVLAPRQVPSIAVLHRVRQGQQVHHVLMASGGVQVTPRDLVAIDVEPYPSLDGREAVADQRPTAVQRWWWDAR